VTIIAEDLAKAAALLMKTAADISFLAGRVDLIMGNREQERELAESIVGLENIVNSVANQLRETAGKFDIPF
jgi:hypothetical protein